MSCAVCGGTIHKGAKIYCSRACYGEAASIKAAEARVEVRRECANCGCSFVPAHRSPRVTCSSACRYAIVSAHHKAVGIRPLIVPSPQEQRDRIKGEAAPWWKGGRMVDADGYVLAIAPDDFPFPEMLGRARRIKEHRLIMALHLGRALSRREVVHHIDCDPGNNDISNLMLFACQGDHKRHHAAMKAK